MRAVDQGLGLRVRLAALDAGRRRVNSACDSMMISPANAGSIVIETEAELACVARHPRRLVWPSVRDLWSNALTGVRQLAPVVYLT